jgi:hypothetical protein
MAQHKQSILPQILIHIFVILLELANVWLIYTFFTLRSERIECLKKHSHQKCPIDNSFMIGMLLYGLAILAEFILHIKLICQLLCETTEDGNMCIFYMHACGIVLGFIGVIIMLFNIPDDWHVRHTVFVIKYLTSIFFTISMQSFIAGENKSVNFRVTLAPIRSATGKQMFTYEQRIQRV